MAKALAIAAEATLGIYRDDTGSFIAASSRYIPNVASAAMAKEATLGIYRDEAAIIRDDTGIFIAALLRYILNGAGLDFKSSSRTADPGRFPDRASRILSSKPNSLQIDEAN